MTKKGSNVASRLDVARDELLLKMAATLCRIAALVGDQVEADELTETRECFADKLDEELDSLWRG